MRVNVLGGAAFFSACNSTVNDWHGSEYIVTQPDSPLTEIVDFENLNNNIRQRMDKRMLLK